MISCFQIFILLLWIFFDCETDHLVLMIAIFVSIVNYFVKSVDHCVFEKDSFVVQQKDPQALYFIGVFILIKI